MFRKSRWLDVWGVGPGCAALGLGWDPGPLGPPSGGQGWGGRVRLQKKAEAEGVLAGRKPGLRCPPDGSALPLFLPKASASRSPAEGAACIHLTSALRCVRRSPSTWVP